MNCIIFCLNAATYKEGKIVRDQWIADSNLSAASESESMPKKKNKMSHENKSKSDLLTSPPRELFVLTSKVVSSQDIKENSSPPLSDTPTDGRIDESGPQNNNETSDITTHSQQISDHSATAVCQNEERVISLLEQILKSNEKTLKYIKKMGATSIFLLY